MASSTSCWLYISSVAVLLAATLISVCMAGDGVNLKPKIKAKIGVEWDTSKPKHHHGHHGEYHGDYHGEYGLHGGLLGGVHGGVHGNVHGGHHHHGGHGKVKGGTLLKMAALGAKLKGSKHHGHHGHHGHNGHHGAHYGSELDVNSGLHLGVGVGMGHHGGLGVHGGAHGGLHGGMHGHHGHGHGHGDAYAYESSYGVHGYHGNGLTHQGTLSGGAHVNGGIHLGGSASAKLGRLPGVGRIFATPHQQELIGVMKDEKAKLRHSLDRYHKSVKRAPSLRVGILSKKRGVTSEVIEDAVDVARHHNNVNLIKAAMSNKVPTNLVFAPESTIVHR